MSFTSRKGSVFISFREPIPQSAAEKYNWSRRQVFLASLPIHCLFQTVISTLSNQHPRSANMTKVALVTGGKGITGSAILEYLVKTTTTSEWSKIVVTSRSPFKRTVQDDRITFIALDFSNDPSILIEQMHLVCADVTHAYFPSYVRKDDFSELNNANEALALLAPYLVFGRTMECVIYGWPSPSWAEAIKGFLLSRG